MAKKKAPPVLQAAPTKDYGDETVAVIPSKDIISILTPNTVTEETYIHKDNLASPIRTYARQNALSMLRNDAETNEDFLQLITYTVLCYEDKVYCTHRLGGDPRLTGKYSIGIGGHVAGGENYANTIYREIEEEVTLKSGDYSAAAFAGYIYCNLAPVNRVHLGLLFTARSNKENIHCREKDKLAGEWITKDELKQLYDAKQLEDWSALAYKYLFGGTHRAQ